MMKFGEMREIVWAITYKPGWSIYIRVEGDLRTGGRPYIQLRVDGIDVPVDPPN